MRSALPKVLHPAAGLAARRSRPSRRLGTGASHHHRRGRPWADRLQRSFRAQRQTSERSFRSHNWAPATRCCRPSPPSVGRAGRWSCCLATCRSCPARPFVRCSPPIAQPTPPRRSSPPRWTGPTATGASSAPAARSPGSSKSVMRRRREREIKEINSGIYAFDLEPLFDALRSIGAAERAGRVLPARPGRHLPAADVGRWPRGRWRTPARFAASTAAVSWQR